jgi:hypothetical protein
MMAGKTHTEVISVMKGKGIKDKENNNPWDRGMNKAMRKRQKRTASVIDS